MVGVGRTTALCAEILEPGAALKATTLVALSSLDVVAVTFVQVENTTVCVHMHARVAEMFESFSFWVNKCIATGTYARFDHPYITSLQYQIYRNSLKIGKEDMLYDNIFI